MTRLRGHFDGQHIVLDEPPPAELTLNTPVEVIVTKSREELIREHEAFVQAMWERPLPPDFKPAGRQWNREDTYERRR
jgi:hypothetical protein